MADKGNKLAPGGSNVPAMSTTPPSNSVLIQPSNAINLFTRDPHKIRDGLLLAWEGKFKDSEKYFNVASSVQHAMSLSEVGVVPHNTIIDF